MEHIKTVLARVMKKQGLGPFQDKKKQQENFIFENWEEIAGRATAKLTEPYKIASNKLFIYVKNSVIMAEMTYKKAEIIKKVNKVFGKSEIKSVIFRIKQ